MKKLQFFCFIVLIQFTFSCTDDSNNDNDEVEFTSLTGAYFGQPLPNSSFVRFAGNYIPDNLYHSVTFSPEGNEMYWADERGLMFSKKINDKWIIPEMLSFSRRSQNGEFYDDAPVVSPDNSKLFFNSLRPHSSLPADGRYHFWYCELTSNGWSDPQPLPSKINVTGIHWQVSISENGTIYFGIVTFSPEVIAGIYFSKFIDNEYTDPEPLTIANNLGFVVAPFVAPDESYVIFAKVVNGGVSIENYISFKGNDSQWSEPQKVTQFSFGESTFVTRDGNYIFCKNYWASVDILESYRPPKLF